MNTAKLVYFSLIIMAFTACNNAVQTDALIGKWQPDGDDSRVLEFTPDGYYNLFVGDMNIFQDIEDYGRIKYKFDIDDNIIKLNLLDETMTKDFVKGEIEIINSDRISIAFYQNNGEVNVQEEYVRIK